MKKLIASLLMAALVAGLSVSLVGCGGKDDKKATSEATPKETKSTKETK